MGHSSTVQIFKQGVKQTNATPTGPLATNAWTTTNNRTTVTKDGFASIAVNGLKISTLASIVTQWKAVRLVSKDTF
jgi:hypothetical protein